TTLLSFTSSFVPTATTLFLLSFLTFVSIKFFSAGLPSSFVTSYVLTAIPSSPSEITFSLPFSNESSSLVSVSNGIASSTSFSSMSTRTILILVSWSSSSDNLTFNLSLLFFLVCNLIVIQKLFDCSTCCPVCFFFSAINHCNLKCFSDINLHSFFNVCI